MVEFSVDTNIYSDSCISKTVYALSDNFVINRKSNGTKETISIVNKIDGKCSEDSVYAIFMEQLNDYKLRDIIERETHDIRVILYAKAFGNFDNVEESDIV